MNAYIGLASMISQPEAQFECFLENMEAFAGANETPFLNGNSTTTNLSGWLLSMNIKTFIAWAVLSTLVGCTTTPPDDSTKLESLPLTAAEIPGGVSLAWNANPSTNVGGYKVYYGQTSGNYTLAKDAGNDYYLSDGTNRGRQILFRGKGL